MMKRRLSALVALVILCLAAVAVAAESDWYYANLDTMPRLPTNKLFYLEQKAGQCPKPTPDGESLNVRMVGKWGGGPSWGVTGKDTLVYLSRGSEVVVINFADTANPKILNYIQAKRLAGRPVLADTLLYLATSGYIEVFNVKDPTNAPRVGRLATPVSDIDVEDTLLYSISADTFRVFDFADPANPHLVGACADSGYALDYDGGYAYLRDRWGMYILDVRDPTSPHRVTSWGTDIAGVKVRGNHCYVAQGSAGSGNLYVLNVSNPASPWQEGVLSGVTCEGMYLVDTLLFTPESYVVDIADSSNPTLVSQVSAGGGEAWVHPSLRWGVTAGWTGGLRVLSLSDIENPVLDTTMLGMFASADISVKNGIACVASQQNYMVLLDISNPALPREVGRYTAGGGMESVLNTGTIAYAPAYAHTHDTVLHAVDISNPASPTVVGSVGGWEGPRAMALRDSFLYAAEPYRFEVFNVANPSQPVWRGRCSSLEMGLCGLDVQGSYGYEIAGAFGLGVIDIADPANPYLVSTTTGRRVNSRGIAVRDTFAYVPSAYDTFWVLSVADPTQPRFLAGAAIGDGGGYDVCLRDSYAFLGCTGFHVFDISSPAQPVKVGYYETPWNARKVACESALIYVACDLAGVCVYEMLPVGMGEPQTARGTPASVRIAPNPVLRTGRLQWAGVARLSSVTVRDVAGRLVEQRDVPARRDGFIDIDFGRLPLGVYFVGIEAATPLATLKVVKR